MTYRYMMHTGVEIAVSRRKKQYGQMEKQRWEESEKRKEEERMSEKRKSQKKEDAGARKGRKVGKHSVFSSILLPRRVEK
jgi:hypothetical protein